METTQCVICGWYNTGNLCAKHKADYKFDKSINSYRLKKKNTGSRYTSELFHKTEIQLTKIIEAQYGQDDVFTSVHPIWAVTSKKVLYEFDIYIKSKNVFIEYNGIQHYEYTKFFHKTKKQFAQQKSRDKKKRKLAVKAGIPVITFSYKEPIFKDYVLDKIQGELRCQNRQSKIQTNVNRLTTNTDMLTDDASLKRHTYKKE
jgi:hypothetical protein